MNEGLEDEIKAFLVTALTQAAEQKGISLEKDANLLELGLIDSLGFLELLTRVEKRFKLKIDFSELSPQEFTSINQLSFRCAQLAQN